MSEDSTRLLPHAEAAEKLILSCIMQFPKQSMRLCKVSQIEATDFHVYHYRLVYETCLELFNAGKVFDFTTVTQLLRERDLLEKAGGAHGITELYTGHAFGPSLSLYIAAVKKASLLRSTLIFTHQASEQCYAVSTDPIEVLQDLRAKVGAALGKAESRKNENQTQAALDKVEDMIIDRELGVSPKGLLTGIPPWDEVLGGILRERYIVIGARPKVGKSAMVEQAMQTQIKNGHAVLCFQQDMSITDMVLRMACRAAGVVYEDFMHGRCTTAELARVRKAKAEINPELLRLFNPHNLTADEMVSIVEREAEEHNIQAFYLDLFQRLRTGRLDKVEGLTLAADAVRGVISRTGVPGILIAEINTQAEKTGRPTASMFKYCDGLFSACDTAIMLWSEDDPKALVTESHNTKTSRRQKVIFTIDANRGGTVSDEEMYFDRPRMKFYEHA